MGNRYATPAGDGLGPLIRDLDELKRRLLELEQPTGTSMNSLVQQVQEAIANINATVTAAIAANSYTKTQIDSKIASPGNISPVNVTASGGGSFAASLSSVGAYNTDVSAMAGARQSVWQHNSGVYGYAPSTIESKANLGPVPFTAADVLAVQPWMYQYRAQMAIRDDAENPYYDPDYVVPWEIGLMAEHLIAHNMECFVVLQDDGVTPKTIDYMLFGAIAPLVVLADMESRLRSAGI
ncbi:hypothetical protein [Agromyces sp. NBRC 114283]|uniref:hypothetical protein n=1 Tax=Agromyces sp. NBRC 114283 TaxID=2994521 RepID=UPI0024A09834|nr:hypothetical protein [Agromyces sp. NBRC 114283]GLU88963.1 hypothetical protein Agsp01_12180 [Agromyces sp. NBRC 114283]